MPYYVFSVKPFAQYQNRAEFAAFREASAHAKALRQALTPGSGEQIKVMFAETEDQAVDLLCQPRVAGPVGDD
jgi:uncharacterized protein YggE